MAVLLMQLHGPMQSWGTGSYFGVRDTGKEPSKSGVVGLVCCALGRSREASIEDVSALRMGVRVDREGHLMCDFHTAGKGGYLRASGKVQKKNVVVSSRYYLSDACFLVGLEGEHVFLESIYQALKSPHWPLFLGRKSFVPGRPVWLADGLLVDETLEDALCHYPSLVDSSSRLRRAVVEVRAGESVPLSHEHIVNDLPISFASRTFVDRRVRLDWLPLPAEEVEDTGEEG